MNIQRLEPGRFHGRPTMSRRVADLILSESLHDAWSRLHPHAHENSYFCIALQGSYTERLRGQEVVCTPSTVTFRRSGQTHQDDIHGVDTRVFTLEIPPTWLDRLWADSLSLDSVSELYEGALSRLFIRINHEFHKNDTAAGLAIEGLALELLAKAIRRRPSPERAIPTWLRHAREMLIEHAADKFSLAEIAACVGVHPVHLATTFRQRFGTTVGEFVRRRRIELACAALRKTDTPLSQIAVDAGFADQSHFSKVFRSYVGSTPRSYRRDNS